MFRLSYFNYHMSQLWKKGEGPVLSTHIHRLIFSSMDNKITLTSVRSGDKMSTPYSVLPINSKVKVC